VIFVQNSVHLAGAQKSLSRLLLAPGMAKFSPRLLTGRKGWLTEVCTAGGVPWKRLDFPSSRSLGGRLWGNLRFGWRASEALMPSLEKNRPTIIHVNDHPDALLGLELARRLDTAPVMTLRTPGMTERDFRKYRCGDYRHLIAVGEDLYERVRRWAGDVPVSLVYNGVTDDEILPPAAAPPVLGAVLVLGSLSPRKGWQDMVEALSALENRLPREQELPEIHFLGDLLGEDPSKALGLERLGRFRVKFLGVTSAYRETLRNYPLSIHPSRSESFGMAALECVAAGVPLLSASAGMIPAFTPCGDFLYEPGDAAGLAEKLGKLLQQDPEGLVTAFRFPEAETIIREKFSTGGTVMRLAEVYYRVAAE
jgi:glycosyltransferase involved in cell wall biosynthesis